jgi:hypothetical protein
MTDETSSPIPLPAKRQGWGLKAWRRGLIEMAGDPRRMLGLLTDAAAGPLEVQNFATGQSEQTISLKDLIR